MWNFIHIVMLQCADMTLQSCHHCFNCCHIPHQISKYSLFIHLLSQSSTTYIHIHPPPAMVNVCSLWQRFYCCALHTLSWKLIKCVNRADCKRLCRTAGLSQWHIWCLILLVSSTYIVYTSSSEWHWCSYHLTFQRQVASNVMTILHPNSRLQSSYWLNVIWLVVFLSFPSYQTVLWTPLRTRK